MPTYQITITNDDFISTSEVDAPDSNRASYEAVKGAIAVGSEQILAGKMFFAAEITLVDGVARDRFVLSIGVSPFK